MVTLNIKPKGHPIKGLPETLEIDLATATTDDLYTAIAQRTRLGKERLRITKGSDSTVLPTRRDDGKAVTIEETGLRNDSHIFVKDLGPQIAWRTVFMVEYLGPLLIHPLILVWLRDYVYSPSRYNPLSYIPFSQSTTVTAEPTLPQAVTCLLVMLHFLKREYETVFVHRFSSATMPAFNIVKNSVHYWVTSGFNLAYFLYAPTATGSTAARWWPTALDPAKNPNVLYAAVALWVFAQVSNYITHVTLRNLRPPGSTKRQIPKGYGFDLVTCPNYLFETLAWVAVAVLSGGNFAAILFLVIAAGQMAVWARKKEFRYRKEFRGAYRRKSSMFPGIW